MAYYVGDIPAEDLVIEPVRGGTPIDVTLFDTATADLFDPAGDEVPTAGFTASLDPDGYVIVEWPSDSVFDVSGVYALVVTLENSDGARERLAPVMLIVQVDDGWTTIDAARSEWPDADTNDWILHRLLELAKGQVIAYGPDIPDGDRPPMRYADAQLMQARNIWNGSKVAPSGDLNDGTGFVIKPFPLDWAVRQTIRPKRTGVVG